MFHILLRKDKSTRIFYTFGNEKQADEICTSSLDESWPNDIYDKDNNVLPTQEEIDETNARLPIIVAEGTLFTHVSYDEATNTQTFYYDYTHYCPVKVD